MTIPFVEDPHHLDNCSLHVFSDALDEGDFWQWVFFRALPTDPRPDDGDDDFYAPEPDPLDSTRCPECGEYGACGYDAEGRPMIHTTTEESHAEDAAELRL